MAVQYFRVFQVIKNNWYIFQKNKHPSVHLHYILFSMREQDSNQEMVDFWTSVLFWG